MKTFIHRLITLSSLSPFTMLALLGLILVGEQTPASAADTIPYKDRIEGTMTKTTTHADQSIDATIETTGTTLQFGPISTIITIHLEAPVYYPEKRAFLVAWKGTNVDRVSVGTFTSAFKGVTIVPVDRKGNLLPPPYLGLGAWTMIDGTGYFKGASGAGTITGWDYANGHYIIMDTGFVRR